MSRPLPDPSPAQSIQVDGNDLPAESFNTDKPDSGHILEVLKREKP